MAEPNVPGFNFNFPNMNTQPQGAYSNYYAGNPPPPYSRYYAGNPPPPQQKAQNRRFREVSDQTVRGLNAASNIVDTIRTVPERVPFAYEMTKSFLSPRYTARPRSLEAQRVIYGGVQPDRIETNKIQMQRTDQRWTPAEQQKQQARRTLDFEEEELSPPPFSPQRFGQSPMGPDGSGGFAPPNTADIGSPQYRYQRMADRLHEQSTGTLWGEQTTHLNALGQTFGDVHERTVSGLNLPKPDYVQPIRAPRKLA